MDSNNINEFVEVMNIKLHTVNEMCIATRNIDSYAKALATLFRWEIAQQGEYYSDEFDTYRGEKANFKGKFSRFVANNNTIELIEVISGNSFICEYLDAFGIGICCLSFTVDDIQDIKELFKEYQIEPIQTGKSTNPPTEWVCFDGREKFACFIKVSKLI